MERHAELARPSLVADATGQGKIGLLTINNGFIDGNPEDIRDGIGRH